MVWVCFQGYGRSDLFILEQDFELKKHGYSAQSYLDVLEDQLPQCQVPSLVFIQDNASIHTARVVKRWFQENGIPIIDWPPYSLDLNLIEHVQQYLKKKVLEMHLELELATSNSEQDIEALEIALIQAWNALPDSLFESLVQSMEKRVAACLKARGWHTKY